MINSRYRPVRIRSAVGGGTREKDMGAITRSILIGMLLAIMITVALFTVSSYAILSIGAEGVRQSQQIARSRGVEIANALATMAGERFDRDMAVKMSAVMHQVVLQSNQQNSDFIVDELLLLNATNDLMAHNDVALLAEGASADFSDEQFESALTAPLREPTRVESIEKKEFEGIPVYGVISALWPAGGDSISERFPEKITTRTRISTAVFPVDQELPAGSVHMFVTHKSTNRFVQGLRQFSVDTLLMIAAFVFLISFIMILLMSVSFREDDVPVRGRRRSGAGSARRRTPGKSIVLETPADDDQAGEAAGLLASPRRDTVLNTRPANRVRRRPPLPGPAAAMEDGVFDRPAGPTPAPTVQAAYSEERPQQGGPAHPGEYAEDYDDETEEFIDDYDDQGVVYDADDYGQPAAPAPTRQRTQTRAEERAAHNPYESAAAAGGHVPYRPGPRIMDAIPLDNFRRNKAAPARKRSRL